MKKNSLLTKLSYTQEIFHEADRKHNPERHWLMKDEYSRVEANDFCHLCAKHYEWNKQFVYNAYLDKFHRIKDKRNE